MSLTDEDKQFIRDVVQGAVSASEARTRDLIEASAAHTQKAIEASEARAQKSIEASEARTREYVCRVETTLLTEFHKWASPIHARVRGHSAVLQALDLEQEDQTRTAAG